MPRITFTPPCGFDISTTTLAHADALDAVATWGYRLVAHPDGSCFVHETYYDSDDGLLGIARTPARPCGDTPDEVHDALTLMEEGLAEPTLRWADHVVEPSASGDGASGQPLL